MKKSDKYYKEQYRPQFHFSPETMWMNDPNGLIFFEEEYHLFYQFNPLSGDGVGEMHWGHAVSNDLIHWKHLPIAIYPDKSGFIFSGSVVVDRGNTTGFGENNKPPLVAVFTCHNDKIEKSGKNNYQSQGLAYSIDKGRNWIKYDKNPVIENPGNPDFRDPKVFWHEKTEKWIMILAAGDCVKIYSSQNLKSWKFESDFIPTLKVQEGVWECPDLFEMKPDGLGFKKWILILSINNGGPNGGSATQYFVGNFDGKQFIIESEEINWIDFGPDNYAGITFSNIPDIDGRRIFLSWMSNWDYATNIPTKPWKGVMCFPRELKLKRDKDGYYLYSYPISEIKTLYDKTVELKDGLVNGFEDLTEELNFDISTLEINLEFQSHHSSIIQLASSYGIEIYNSLHEKLSIEINPNQKSISVDRSKALGGAQSDKISGKSFTNINFSSKTKLCLLLDHSSIEVFAEDGKVNMTSVFFPEKKLTHIGIFTNDGDIYVKSFKIMRLKSIWQAAK